MKHCCSSCERFRAAALTTVSVAFLENLTREDSISKLLEQGLPQPLMPLSHLYKGRSSECMRYWIVASTERLTSPTSQLSTPLIFADWSPWSLASA